MSSKKAKGPRDTAKDIILGLAPSGQGPRQPKEGVATKREDPPPSRRPTQPVRPTVVVDRRPDNSAIQSLKEQLVQLERQNKELLANEQAARRRLEANQDALQRRLITSDTQAGMGSRETDDLRRQLITAEGKMMNMSSEINNLRSSLDRQVNDLMHINNEMKARPVVDPSKIATSTQQLDGKIRDLHGQLMQMKQAVEGERVERARETRALNETIARLQDIIRQQDQSKNDILNNLSRKGDMDKEKLSEEAKRLNEKINLITSEVTRNMVESTTRLKDDVNGKYGTLEAALRVQGESLAELERDGRRRWEQNGKAVTDQMEVMSKQMQVDRAKHKDRFQKVNEALAALEHHLELGNKKMDKIMGAEVQSRRLHEKGLLSKITEVEEKLSVYMGGLNKTIDDVKTGSQSATKMPQLDVDALRREMEAIAADKNKLSMEGLLKLEEKMTRVQTGLYHDKRELTQKMVNMEDSEQANRIRGQMNKLDAVQEDMEKAQERIRDKVEKQIPQDLNELSAKSDNLKHQLNARIDKEEEERYLAIKELQEAFQRLQSKNAAMPIDEAPTSLKRDVDECKTAIKKLAESVTTVKNVLDKKITDETRQRQADVARLSHGN